MKKHMTLEQYFKTIHPVYSTLQITPHSSIRNYNSAMIGKMITTMYKAINKRIYIEEKRFVVETKVKCSYVIDVYKNEVKFYFIVPQQYMYIAIEKISSVWDKATIEECAEIPPFTHKNVSNYQLNYTKLDAFSLAIDKKSNYPLNNILNVIDIMEESDRITVIYNFIPCSQYGWNTKCEKAHKKLKEGTSIKKQVTGISALGMVFFEILDLIDKVLENLLGGKLNKDFNIVADLSEVLRNTEKQVSQNTKNKRHSMSIATQIGVISCSDNVTRLSNNAISVCQSYQDIGEDNELEYEKILSNKALNMYTTKFDGFRTNKVSTEECQNFIQLPARELLERHRISHVNVTETNVPEQLQSGYMWVGKNTCKGNTIDTYMSDEPNINNLPLIPMGQMGAGKTTLLGGVANNIVEKRNEGVIVIDFIKKCELSDYISRHTPKNRLIDIDLSIPEQRQAFCYNEIDVSKCETIDDIVDAASLLSQEAIRLIDGVNTEGEPLKPKMRRYLSSACNVVFTYPNTTLKDVVQCLEDHERRHGYIERLGDELRIALDEEVNNLLALDEKKNGTIIDTKDGKIEGVLDRINLLKEDSKLKYMFNMSPKNNINFVDAMNQGKVVLIRMPQAKFSRHHRNILTTFFISKVWLACTIRGDTQDKPLRNHLIVDEIFDAPTSFNVLQDMLVQVRKFQLKLIFSVHYLSQIEPIREALKASGASYMLLQGTDKKNYKELESELQPFTVDDLLNLKQYHSLNLIKYSKGYAKFIGDLTVKL